MVVWLCLVFLCVHLLVPPRAGMGTQRVELGVVGISGSVTRAVGFNVTAEPVGSTACVYQREFECCEINIKDNEKRSLFYCAVQVGSEAKYFNPW